VSEAFIVGARQSESANNADPDDFRLFSVLRTLHSPTLVSRKRIDFISFISVNMLVIPPVVRLLEGKTFIDKEIAPILFDLLEIVNPEETKEEARRLKDRHILVAFLLAFELGWFWSRFHYAPQRPGAQIFGDPMID
jgi:hypothetical protein